MPHTITIAVLSTLGASVDECCDIADAAHVTFGDATFTLVQPYVVLNALRTLAGDSMHPSRAGAIATLVKATDAQYIAFSG